MVDIVHRIGATASQEDVYAALTTIDGLAGWWTEDTKADGDPEGSAASSGSGSTARPSPAASTCGCWSAPVECVLWEVVEGPDEWLGTHIEFELSQEDGYTIVMFRPPAGARPCSSCTTAAPSGRRS